VSLLSHSITAQKPKNLSLFLIALGVAVALLYYGQVFFVTLVIAITIAFLMDPFVELLMKVRIPRSVASFIVCVVGLLLVYLAGLGAYTQVAVIIEDLPTYTERIAELTDRAAAQLDHAEKRAYELLVPRRLQRDETPEPEPVPSDPAARRRRSAEPPKPVAPVIPEVRIREEKTPLISHLYDYLRAFYLVILMASFVPFLVYFMLSWKDHIRRSYLHLFEGQDRQAAGRSWEGIADMARAYVLGNFVLGVILSVASGLFFWAIKLPYFLLIGPLSGFLSLIPYIGLPLAMIPPFFVALPVYDHLTPYLIIGTVVGFLHLLALNLLYPKLVGSRVHLNPLAVTVALMFFGVLWGGAGLILAIPITAGVKAVCDNVPSLQAYGKLLGD
jgi:predicted PurR-regulated permease PerM